MIKDLYNKLLLNYILNSLSINYVLLDRILYYGNCLLERILFPWPELKDIN